MEQEISGNAEFWKRLTLYVSGSNGINLEEEEKHHCRYFLYLESLRDFLLTTYTQSNCMDLFTFRALSHRALVYLAMVNSIIPLPPSSSLN